MLVDDEKLILQGLLNIIEWEQIGLNVVSLAENGQEALDKFEENPVDIVVTDINMPVITGLEILQRIKSTKKEVKFIILTGYDEFEYAKTAIKYGVESYILKPVNEEELTSVLIKIVNDFKEQKEIENKLINKNINLMALINGKLKIDSFREIQSLTNLKNENKDYTVSNILFKDKEINLLNEVEKVLDKKLDDKFEIMSEINGNIIVVNEWDKRVTEEDIKEYFETIRESLYKKLKQEVFIAIGSKVKDIKELEESYKISNNLKKYVLTKGYNVCFDISKENGIKTKSRTYSKEMETLNKFILEKDASKIKEYVGKLFYEEDLLPQNIYDLSLKILLLIDKISEDFKYNKNYNHYSLSNVIIDLCNENSRESIKIFIENSIIELIKAMTPDSKKYTPIVQQVLNYIEDKYYEELSLKTLSLKYNINSSYLGQIFSKEVGLSFSEYLNRIKNSKARELILNTNMKINDIAQKVGYIDTSYFYRKFKKHYGISPAALREIKNY